ncbi:hypothetical protein SPRG_01356 [Saprolegnia parasitica CBS 223.65]|uniref:Uncharacterized protein n=1 Tax=Saprolegnia parasitica (strain CBS 223.65) TaxID=695850 RepID=A0A067D500_SAPPC|nr:hypothetical protein SPRG_01356 [Saprolegnia parasitica CBS 223.65]KDO34082.1 hypothetical protein SPRG_01356 [Saprolegnia parasitica CBS 223.65]|eukprot:XP_012194966.1 hypothetical protein SPRG_01356 [Saprolegnia parasitica CBS 223.65]
MVDPRDPSSSPQRRPNDSQTTATTVPATAPVVALDRSTRATIGGFSKLEGAVSGHSLLDRFKHLMVAVDGPRRARRMVRDAIRLICLCTGAGFDPRAGWNRAKALRPGAWDEGDG